MRYPTVWRLIGAGDLNLRNGIIHFTKSTTYTGIPKRTFCGVSCLGWERTGTHSFGEFVDNAGCLKCAKVMKIKT